MSVLIKNLTISYDHHPAVQHLDAFIKQGEWWAIVGPNGAGKSTLLNALAGIITAYEGSIEGLNSEAVAYLPQHSKLDTSFPITVFDLVATGLWREIGFFRGLSVHQRDSCVDALEAVGLNGFEDRLIGSLSGGQMQRSLFARVLVQNESVILLDEPFNAIDIKTSLDLTEIIKQWHKNDRTVNMVTHDLDYVRQHCQKSLLIARECVDFGVTKNVLTDKNLKYARQLSEAFDNTSFWCAG